VVIDHKLTAEEIHHDSIDHILQSQDKKKPDKPDMAFEATA